MLCYGFFCETHAQRTPLYELAWHDDVAEIERLIGEGADVDERYPNTEPNYGGYTALMVAAGRRYLGVMEVLIKAGADLNVQSIHGSTAIMLAIADPGPGGERIDAVKMLIAAGADVNKKDTGGLTALHFAADNGFVDIVGVLLTAGANVDTQANNGFTALMYAVRKGALGVVEVLLEGGASPDIENVNGDTALTLSSARIRVAITEVLVEKGHIKRRGSNALHVTGVDSAAFSVYPSPVTDTLHITSREEGVLFLYTPRGTLADTHHLAAGHNAVPLTRHSAGVYVAHVVSDGGRTSLRIVKR